MSLLWNISQITGTTILSKLSSSYIINITANSTITIPLINCDGIRIVLMRNDTNFSAIATISATSPNVIYQSSGTSSLSMTMNNNSSYELVSYSNNWYVSERYQNLTGSSGSFLSGTCTSNSTIPYISITNVSVTAITQVVLPPNFVPTGMSVTIFNISTSSNNEVNVDLRNTLDASYINYIRIPFNSNIPSGTFAVFSVNTILNTPPTNTVLYAVWSFSAAGSGQKTGVCSLRIF